MLKAKYFRCFIVKALKYVNFKVSPPHPPPPKKKLYAMVSFLVRNSRKIKLYFEIKIKAFHDPRSAWVRMCVIVERKISLSHIVVF